MIRMFRITHAHTHAHTCTHTHTLTHTHTHTLAHTHTHTHHTHAPVPVNQGILHYGFLLLRFLLEPLCDGRSWTHSHLCHHGVNLVILSLCFIQLVVYGTVHMLQGGRDGWREGGGWEGGREAGREGGWEGGRMHQSDASDQTLLCLAHL